MAAEMAEQIGARIKARRDELGLTQAGLAAEITGKTTGDQVSRWERGKHLPRDMNPIAEALGVETSYFYAPEPDKSVTPDLSIGNTEPAAPSEERLARMEKRLAAHARKVEKLLDQQSKLLRTIEKALEEDRQLATALADDGEDFARRVVQAARRELQADAQNPVADTRKREQSGTRRD